MRQRISSLLARATMTLLLAVLTTVTAWADTWPEYISEVKVLGASASNITALKTQYKNAGWTIIDFELNDGAGGDWIYLAYKKASRNSTDYGYITDFYISNHNGIKTLPSSVSYDGKTYYLCDYAGDSYFCSLKGDLNSDAGGDDIHLYYTKENFDDRRVVNNIYFNTTQSGAVKKNGNEGNGYDLNTGCGSSSTDIYMHLTTTTKTNRPTTDPVMASGLVYNGSEQQLIATPATLANGTMKYRIGTSGDWKTNISQLTATNAGDYIVQYYAGSTPYGNVSTTHQTTVSIAKSPNSGVTVSCADILEGNTLTPQLGGNLSTGAVTYKYCTTPDGTYTTTAPTAHGTYYVKATIAGDNNCEEFTTAAATFTIRHDWTLHNSGNSEADAYVISTTDDLDLLAQRVNAGTDYKNKFFKLGADITYSHTTDWDDATSTENNFTAIGKYSHIFRGAFDGNGKTISGIRISLKDFYNGLFGYIDDGATVKNVIVSDARIIGWSFNGGIAGECKQSTITNCWVKSDVCIGEGYEIGGITGENINGTISGCRSEATLKAYRSDYKEYGGITGYANSIAVSHCVVVGATIPEVSNYRGAVVGANYSSTLTTNYYSACTVAGVANAANVGCQGADAAGARQAVAIGAATGVTVTPTGTATTYDVSGITAYVGNKGISFGDQLYAGAGETVTFNIEYTVPDGCIFNGFTDGNGNALTDNGDGTYTLTMTSAAPTITPDLTDLWGITAGRDGSTAAKAYLITTPAGLDLLAQRVNNGTSNYKGKFFKLADTFDNSKSPMTTTIGTESNPFAGTFNGNGKTLTVNINETSTQGTAPFRNICDGAVIKNLTVTGSVTGTTYAAGLVGFSRGGSFESPNTIEGCTVNVNVSVSTGINKHMGGVVGHALTSYLKIKNTVYGGTMYNNDHYAGGLQGWSESNHLTIDNCLFKGSYTGSGKFHPVAIHNSGKTTTATVSKCYYTAEPTLTDASYIAAEGILVSTTPASLYRPVTAADGNDYYAIATVSGLRNYYLYTGSPITISYTVKDGETTLVEGTHYTTELRNGSNALISKEDGVYKVTDNDTYTMSFTGISPCGGTLTKEFMVVVVDGISVTSGMTDWTEVSYYVLDDVTIDDRITVTGNVRLYLEEGTTLTANKGISVESGNTLTIEGKGTLNATGNDYNAGIGGTSNMSSNQSEHGHIIINGGTINATGGSSAAGIGGGNNSTVSDKSSITINGGTVTAQGGDYGAGIGGGNRYSLGNDYGMPGTIVINGGQVTANGGGDAQGIGKGSHATGTTGSLTLDWTNESDFIKSSGYNIDNISFAKGKFFVLDGTSTIATTSNIGGKKIVPSWPAPTDFAVAENGITNRTATLQWTGYSDSYTVSYRTAEGISPVISEGFENGIEGWTLRDCAGATGVSSISYTHSGNAAFRFYFYTTPPQYLISPELTDISEGMKLEFYYKNSLSNYPETFQVGFSTTDNETSSFTFGNEVTASDTEWHLYSVKIPAGTKYFCIKYTSNNKFYLYIDDIVIGTTVAAGDWQTVTVEEPTATLTGLTPETTYDAKVQGNNGEVGLGNETNLITFTTEVLFPAPTGLAVTAYTATSMTLSWTEKGDATAWQICLDNDENNLIDVTQYPYTLTDLTAETTYNVKVRADYGENKSEWSSDVTFEPTVKTVIGSGTTTSSVVPTNTISKYSLSQQIYTSAELGDAGLIESIDFFNESSQIKRNLNIYMVSTDKDEFTSNTDWISVTDDNLVFSGNVTFFAGVWTTIALDNCFVYDGNSNVVIVVDDNTGSSNAAVNFRTFTASDKYQALSAYSYNNDIDPMGSLGDVNKSKNQIRIMKSELVDCMQPMRLKKAEVGPDFVTLSWQENGTATEWIIQLVEDIEGSSFADVEVITANSNPYTIHNLSPETIYKVRVRPACNTEDESLWSQVITFGTLAANPVPTDLAATNVISSSADVSWKGYGESYHVRYRKPSYIDGIIPEEFNSIGSSSPSGWTKKSGLLSDVLDGKTTLSNGGIWYFGNKNDVFDSHAYINIYGTSRQGWLITPSFTVSSGATVSFDLALTAFSGSNAPAPEFSGDDDKFVVLISTNDMNTWTILRQWDNADSEYVYNYIETTGEKVTIDLNNYVGETACIAFYGESTASNADNNLHIDNVCIGTTVDATEWQTVNTTEAAANLTGLDPATAYEWQVQSVKDNQESDWSSSATFTTFGGLELADDDSEKPDGEKNADLISTDDGTAKDVMLVGRTLYKDGKWNTICLPFDVDMTDPAGPLYGATYRTVIDASIDGTTLNITFAENTDDGYDDNTLKAGVPYIIKWDKASDYVDDDAHNIVNPVFIGVNPNNVDVDFVYGDESVWFNGTYDAIPDITSHTMDGYDVLLMGGDNTLHHAGDGESLGAFRAYFLVNPTKVGNARLTDYVFDLGNGEILSGTFPSTIQPGDANGDGNISVTDIAVVVNYILQLPNTNFSFTGADANGDGYVTVTDIGVIVDKILGSPTPTPPEGGEPQ